METTMKGACAYANRTRASLYLAIKRNRLKAKKSKDKYGRWVILRDDIDEYMQSRYDRSFVSHKGELVYNKGKGIYSIYDAREILGCSLQHLYYAIRTHKIASKKIGGRLIVMIDDILNYRTVMRVRKKSTEI